MKIPPVDLSKVKLVPQEDEASFIDAQRLLIEQMRKHFHGLPLPVAITLNSIRARRAINHALLHLEMRRRNL